jgi:putative transposase
MRGRFSEAQILGFLREVSAGTPAVELCWAHSFSRSTFRGWKAKYGVAIDAEAGRLQDLELENARLRKSLAIAHSDVERLRHCRCPAQRYSNCSGTNGPSNMLSKRMNGVTSGSWESTTSP